MSYSLTMFSIINNAFWNVSANVETDIKNLIIYVDKTAAETFRPTEMQKCFSYQINTQQRL